MFTQRANRITAMARAMVFLVMVAVIAGARPADGTTDAGAVISNRAEATYNDKTGVTYNAVSETVTVTVSTVAAVVVTPDETASSQAVGPHEQITRAFRICNSGNTTDTFTPTRFEVTAPAKLVALYFDNDAGGTVTNGDAQIELNQTKSPATAPHGCVGVLAVVNTNDAAAQSTITLTLTARSDAGNAVNGQGEDTGTIINAVGNGPRLTSPANPNLAPVKLINGTPQTVLSASATFTYTVDFKNSGDTVAHNVVFEDQLSPG